ncbi:MAG: hypothetical protein H7X71_00035 [Chitinophagales bacterium]|nr:hypothetical protein [Chitinophagales bacterium]
MYKFILFYIILSTGLKNYSQNNIEDIYKYMGYVVSDTNQCIQPYSSYSFVLDKGITSAVYRNETISETELKEVLNSIFYTAKKEDHAVLINYVFINDISFSNIYAFT